MSFYSKHLAANVPFYTFLLLLTVIPAEIFFIEKMWIQSWVYTMLSIVIGTSLNNAVKIKELRANTAMLKDFMERFDKGLATETERDLVIKWSKM